MSVATFARFPNFGESPAPTSETGVPAGTAPDGTPLAARSFALDGADHDEACDCNRNEPREDTPSKTGQWNSSHCFQAIDFPPGRPFRHAERRRQDPVLGVG